MNRKDFFKKLGLGVATVIVAPGIIAEIGKPVLSTGGIIPHLASEAKRQAFLRQYPLTFKECFPPEEVLRIYRQTGSLIYRMRPYQEDIQQSWFKLQEALDNAKS